MNQQIRGIRARAYRSIVLAIPFTVALVFGMAARAAAGCPTARVEARQAPAARGQAARWVGWASMRLAAGARPEPVA